MQQKVASLLCSSASLRAIVTAIFIAGIGLTLESPSQDALPLVLIMMIVVSATFNFSLRTTHSYRLTWNQLILPNLMVIGAALFLRLAVSGSTVTIALVVSSLMLILTMWAEEQNVSSATDDRRWSRLTLLIISYMVVFAMFAAISEVSLPAWFKALVLVGVTVLISIRVLLLTGESLPLLQLASLALLVGVIVGEIYWALDYLHLSAMLCGAMLLTALNFLLQVLCQHIGGGATPRRVVEHGVTCLIAVSLAVWRSL